MKSEEELIETICRQKNNRDMLIELVRKRNNKELYSQLKMFSEESSINEDHKIKIYNVIYDYIESVNEEFLEKIDEIYKIACKDTINFIKENKVVF